MKYEINNQDNNADCVTEKFTLDAHHFIGWDRKLYKKI